MNSKTADLQELCKKISRDSEGIVFTGKGFSAHMGAMIATGELYRTLFCELCNGMRDIAGRSEMQLKSTPNKEKNPLYDLYVKSMKSGLVYTPYIPLSISSLVTKIRLVNITSRTKHRIWNILQHNGMSKTYLEMESRFGPPMVEEWKLQVNDKFLAK